MHCEYFSHGPLNDVFWWIEVLDLNEVQLLIHSLPSERHSALGFLSAVVPKAEGWPVLTCRTLPSPSHRSLLLRGLAVDSPGAGWSCCSYLDKQNPPLFLTHGWTYFLCDHSSWMLELCHPPRGLLACHQQPVLFPWVPPHSTFQHEPHPRLIRQAEVIHSSFSSASWLWLCPLLPWQVIFSTCFSVLSAREHFSRSPLYWVTI